MPAYREGEALATNLEQIIRVLRVSKLPFEIVLVVDKVVGDNTDNVARRITLTYPEVRLLIREGKRGVGTAICAGISIASGEIIMPVMGDAAESASDVVAIAHKAQEGYDIVVGNRFMKKDSVINYPPLKYCANRLCNLLVRLLFRIPTSDVTNAFKAYSAKALKDLDLSSTGYSIFLELPVKTYLNGAQHLVEVPVGHIAERKKHGLSISRDGITYFLTLLRMLFYKQLPENP